MSNILVAGEPQVFRVAAANKNGVGEFREVVPCEVLKGKKSYPL